VSSKSLHTSPSQTLGRIALIGIFLLTSGCANAPDLIFKGDSTNKESGDDEDGNLTGGNCDSAQTQDFSINPASSRAANVLFVIDDSGSMSDEIQEVVSKIEPFLQGLQAATADQLRLGLLFDHSKEAFNYTKALYNSSTNQNPFAPYIDNVRVHYFQSETWSHWADVGFFKAFGKGDYIQTFPTPMPTDFEGVTASSCSGAGKYFRPRRDQPWGSSPTCNSSNKRLSLTNYFTPDVAMNVVMFSDDDLTASTSGLVREMYRGVLNELTPNAPFYYHSIIMTDNLGLASGQERMGHVHMGLSEMTNGMVFDLRENDYGPVFSQLKDRILFSEQTVSLSCEISASRTPQVIFNGVILNPSLYSYVVGSKQIRLDPDIFTPDQIGTTIPVRVTY